MPGHLSRKQLAERLGVKPDTIYRWEKRADCPVRPKRLVRTRELLYCEEDVLKYEAWMNKTEEVGRAA